MSLLPGERSALKSSEYSFKVFGPSLKFKDAQVKPATIMILCLPGSTKAILMKRSADFECILGLSKHVWEIQKKDTIGQKKLHKRQKLEASELCIL